jgi:hypothetical protein
VVPAQGVTHTRQSRVASIVSVTRFGTPELFTLPISVPRRLYFDFIATFFQVPIRGISILLGKDAPLMATATKKHPVILNMAISKDLQADLSNMAAKKNVSVAELVCDRQSQCDPL